MMFSENEQEETINEFLNGQSKEIEENDDFSYGMITEERLRQEYNEHIKRMNGINTTKYTAVKKQCKNI